MSTRSGPVPSTTQRRHLRATAAAHKGNGEHRFFFICLARVRADSLNEAERKARQGRWLRLGRQPTTAKVVPIHRTMLHTFLDRFRVIGVTPDLGSTRGEYTIGDSNPFLAAVVLEVVAPQLSAAQEAVSAGWFLAPNSGVTLAAPPLPLRARHHQTISLDSL